jgi:hypothetical protein
VWTKVHTTGVTYCQLVTAGVMLFAPFQALISFRLFQSLTQRLIRQRVIVVPARTGVNNAKSAIARTASPLNFWA